MSHQDWEVWILRQWAGSVWEDLWMIRLIYCQLWLCPRYIPFQLDGHGRNEFLLNAVHTAVLAVEVPVLDQTMMKSSLDHAPIQVQYQCKKCGTWMITSTCLGGNT